MVRRSGCESGSVVVRRGRDVSSLVRSRRVRRCRQACDGGISAPRESPARPRRRTRQVAISAAPDAWSIDGQALPRTRRESASTSRWSSRPISAMPVPPRFSQVVDCRGSRASDFRLCPGHSPESPVSAHAFSNRSDLCLAPQREARSALQPDRSLPETALRRQARAVRRRPRPCR